MLAYVKGSLAKILPGVCVVDLHGFGLRIHVPVSDAYQHLKMGERVELQTHYQQKEDGVSIFGFLTVEELELFELLISVSGIGPRNALNILSFASTALVCQWLIQEDVNSLKRIPGIGIKTAQRMILELKSKVADFEWNQSSSAGMMTVRPGKERDEVHQAIEALLVLGYDLREATKQVHMVSTAKPGARVEVLIKDALQQLLR